MTSRPSGMQRGLAGMTASALVAAQLALPPQAQASHLGSSTASAGSAPPPAVTAIQSFQPDLFTGRATTTIPLAVPPGRHGLQPSLALAYASSSQNGWVGVGWSLDVGYIERSIRQGVPAYDVADTYTFMFQGASSELVRIPDGTYRAKEEGLFLRFASLGVDGWEVRDKSGTRYLFGGVPEAEQRTDRGIFRWGLRTVLDLHGNGLTIAYLHDQGQIYPSRIDYTGHEQGGIQDLPPANAVELIWEDRPDVVVSLRSGAQVTTAKRLKELRTYATVEGTRQPARTYRLAYTQSARTGRSLLAGVTQAGTDGTTSLPPATFSYQNTEAPTYAVLTNNPSTSQAAWNVRQANLDTGHENFGCVNPGAGLPWSAPQVVTGSTDLGCVSAEVGGNGDLSLSGCQDHFGHAFVFLYTGAPKTVSISLASGSDAEACLWRQDASGMQRIEGWGSLGVPLAAGWSLLHLTSYHQHQGWGPVTVSGSLIKQVDLMGPTQFIAPHLAADVDGNGTSDLVSFDPFTGSWSVSCANTCTILPAGTWLSGFGQTEGDIAWMPLVGDFDGDGKTDVALYSGGQWRFARSTGTSFQAWYWGPVSFGSGTPLLGDFNGDGLTDLGTYDAGAWTITLARHGHDFTGTPAWTLSWGDRSREPLTGDFNGDGLTDLGLIDESSGTLEVRLATGSGVGPASTWIAHFSSNQSHTSADVNGDGLTDAVAYDKPSGHVRYALSTGTSFSTPATLPVTFALRGRDDQLQVADFNGDGLMDPAVLNAFTDDSQLALSAGQAPDLLTQIGNGVGGTTTITYQASPALTNTALPFVIPVVQQVSASDGLGHSYSTSYTYEGGLFDGWRREFLGFARAQVRDVEGIRSTTEFIQEDPETKGRPTLITVQDASGRLYTKTEQTWYWTNPYPDAPEVTFAYLDQVDHFLYDGDATVKHTRARSEYDAFGNLTKLREWGEVDVEGDERQTFTTYTYNPAAWILNHPAYTKTTDAADESGRTLSQQWLFYDGRFPADVGLDPDGNPLRPDLTPPALGELTAELEWLDTLDPHDANPLTRMSYDAFGNVETVTDALGRTTTNTYDERGTYLVRVTNVLGHTRSVSYDPRTGAVLRSTDQNGLTTLTDYDPLGRVIATKLLAPGATEPVTLSSLTYDLSTIPIRTTTTVFALPNYQSPVTSYQFVDGLGRTIQTRSPAEDPGKQIVTGAVEFNARGQIARQWVSYLAAASSSYVPLSPEPPAPSLASVSYLYDPVGRLISLTDSDGATTTTAYDDWTVTVTDANGHQTRRTSDAYGRLVKVEEFLEEDDGTPVIAPTAYAYDPRNNLVQVTDAKGNMTRIAYDSLGRKTSMDDPDMGRWRYAYDAVDNLIEQRDAKQTTTRFAYDALNRLTRKEYVGAGAIAASAPPIRYTYDTQPLSTGKLIRVQDGSGSSAFTYDALGRLIAETKTLSVGDTTATVHPTPFTMHRAYDLLGRLIRLTYPDGDVATYTYNLQGGLETVTLQAQGSGLRAIVKNIDYNAAGQLTRLEYGNGVATDYSYDPHTLRLSSLITQHSSLGQTLQDFSYTFDPVGNITDIRGQVAAYGGGMRDATQHFAYDALSRLTQAQGPYGDFHYAYDPLGNLLDKEGRTMVYGEGGAGPHAVTSVLDPQQPSHTLALIYDANGNLLSKTSSDSLSHSLTASLFSYDAENRLIEVTAPIDAAPILGYDTIHGSLTPAQRVEQHPLSFLESPVAASGTLAPAAETTRFVYDGDGGRVQQITTAGTTTFLGESVEIGPDGTVTKYLFAGAQRLASLSAPPQSRPGASSYKQRTPPSEATLQPGKRFTPRAAQSPQPRAPSLRYYHGDHLGSTSLVTDQSGQVVEMRQYTPYGSVVAQSPQPPAPSPFGFTGQRLDASTGLYFFHARYYDPELGRFIQPDTIVQAPGDPQTLNRYTYANNNPLNNVDPSGHGWFSKLFGWVSAALSFLLPPLAPFLTLANLGLGIYNAAQTGNWLGFVGSTMGSFAGGAVFGAIGQQVGLGITNAIGSAALQTGLGGFLSGAISGAAEFGLAGFGSGLGGALGGGASFKEAFKAGGLSAAFSGSLGAGIQGSYLGGLQGTLHGNSIQQIATAQGFDPSVGAALGANLELRTNFSEVDVYRHYSYADEAGNLARGLDPSSWGTKDFYTSGKVAQQKLSIPPHRLGDASPNAVYNVFVDRTRTQVLDVASIPAQHFNPSRYAPQGAFRTGGGSGGYFPLGTPPGSVIYGGPVDP